MPCCYYCCCLRVTCGAEWIQTAVAEKEHNKYYSLFVGVGSHSFHRCFFRNNQHFEQQPPVHFFLSIPNIFYMADNVIFPKSSANRAG